MPELPEVETIRRDLKKVIRGKTIRLVDGSDVGRGKIVRTGWKTFVSGLLGSRVTELSRQGKLLSFHLDTGRYILIHLKMTGQLIYVKDKDIIPGGHGYPFAESCEGLNKYSHVWFGFHDGSHLIFNDMRQFGFIQLVDSKNRMQVLRRFGIDALSDDLTKERFRALVQGRKAAVKAILLNQNLVSGIGNIYADEICFSAGVRPDKPVSRLSRNKLDALFDAIRMILEEAIEWRGTTFSDYRDGEGRRGNYLTRLKVYGREGQPCLRCGKSTIRKKTVAGRGTCYCPRCQR